MTKEQERVKNWMVKFGQDAPDKPTEIDEKTAKLRAALILEEALETIIKGLGLSIDILDDGNQVRFKEGDLKNFKHNVSFNKRG